MNHKQEITDRISSGQAIGRSALSILRDFPESRLVAALLIGGSLIAAQAPAFLSSPNIRGVLLAFSFVAVAALGQLLVIATGRIDLSTGSNMALAGMLTALALKTGVTVPLALVIGVSAGGLVGVVNAFFCVRLHLSSFIVTLGSLQIARGITIGLTQGDTISGFTPAFLALGSTSTLGLPVPVWLALLLLLVFTVTLRYTTFGRDVYSIGGNETAARLAGVKVDQIQTIVFMIAGAMAGLAGALLTARLGASVSNAATGYELIVIASVVIGGASLSGGVGTALGVVLGALLISVVNNALVLLIVPTYWQQTFIGAVIVVAALIDKIRRS